MEEEPALPDSPTEDPLHLTIRFASSLPDLQITIPSPFTTTIASVKRQIRALRPEDTGNKRLRLIYSGRQLSDNGILSSSVRLPPRSPTLSASNSNSKGKGKASEPIASVYIHCSIGGSISAIDLEKEIDIEKAVSDKLAAPSSTTTRPPTSTTTTTGPRGFDRLLSAGFTPQEIANLRAQLLQQLSLSHTPDNMPSGSALLALEDQWMDESASPNQNAGGDGNSWGDIVEGGQGYEDMFLGTVMGFFWPIGALVWLCREEGVWNKRRVIAVLVGTGVNFCFSILQVTA
jgi:DUF2407 C-terminal domain/DUF2407 ubiquitin-like domain